MVRRIGTAIAVTLMVMSTTVCQLEAKQTPPVLGHESTANRSDAEKPIAIEQAMSIGRAWLDALKAKDFQKVFGQTRLPFTYRDTSPNKLCNGTAADVKQLTTMMSCLEKHVSLLFEELGQAEKLRLRVVTLREVPPSLLKVIETPNAGHRMVSTFINGDGITFELLLLIAPTDGNGAAGVKALFVSSETESG